MRNRIRSLNEMSDSRLLYEKNLPAFGYLLLLTVTALLIAVIAWSIHTPKVDVIKAEGIIESENKNYVMSQYTGELITVNVEEGDYVEKGDILFQIKSTDLDLQITQLKTQKEHYETELEQYKKLVQSIQDDTNYFDAANPDDSLYYSQFEIYKSQIEQNQLDITMLRLYGYSEEQVQEELVKNESKLMELYHSAIQSAESAATEANEQIQAIDAQISALENGQGEYNVAASENGVIHMISDYKEGMIVQAAAPIASIASELDEYKIVATVSPDERVRIQEGDTVDIEISGLSQSVFGTVEGVVTLIDSDVTIDQSAEGGAYFKIQIEPKETYLISKSGNTINLSNGMKTEVRIQYDEISYFDYFLESLGVISR